jgi:hypothetical protein
MVPVTINNGGWSSPPSDRCDYAHGCNREVVAVLGMFAYDDTGPLDAIAERRPFCAKHLAIYAEFHHKNSTRYEVHPVSFDDLCCILEQRGTRDSAMPEWEL